MPNIDQLESIDFKQLLKELRRRETMAGDPTANLVPDALLQDFDSDTLIEALKARQEALFPPDNRTDLFQIGEVINLLAEVEAILDDADSVVNIFTAAEVTDNGDGTSTLQTREFGQSTTPNLCQNERFRTQPCGGLCSGFLVAANIITTAGHCIAPHNLTEVRFVFGFRMINAAEACLVIDNTEIYQGAELIDESDTDSSDWALVRLDRPVTNHKIAKIRRQGRVEDGVSVHIIGHPFGLPAKYAGDASVQDNNDDSFFRAELDTFGGNSGSPVFNSDTHEVEGILVKGEDNFVWNTQQDCLVSLICGDECLGGQCTRTTEFSHLVP